MIQFICNLRAIDQVLIVGYIIFMVFIIGAITYVQSSIWNANFRQAIESAIKNLQAVTERLCEEEYADWMDEEKLKRNR